MARALSDPDLHWAAQHYLSIPAELVESLHPADGLDLPLEDEIYYLPGQALVRVIEHALSVSQSVDPEARGEVLKEWRQYVALHVALDRLPLTSQHAYELSRQSDELARRLHRKGTSGAEALRAYGLLR
ncbi:hypothetical protein HS99_0025955 [Kitasatospora aureofaciens]|uniref:Uncharacterized protein n=2 Tax=Kitasatospora aureofaciens TaxID=1894 RepID=A0A1E7N9V8_KITAU|nr:hypothetical protein B6264_09400 [Kitasatospora aureofaciens]OEV37469.1 hypothetical protein HS99_0025955 [Kitasatospora aureofaciens]GGU82712.1 hypothetical protein GCM10010502_38400 [Kitasatospora aureofaciens]